MLDDDEATFVLRFRGQRSINRAYMKVVEIDLSDAVEAHVVHRSVWRGETTGLDTTVLKAEVPDEPDFSAEDVA